MNRFLALVLALLFASVTVSSACASSTDTIGFTLAADRGSAGLVQARFRDQSSAHDRTDWSGGFKPSELIGLDTSGFRSSGTQPLRFALVREAGRLDCAGTGGSGQASGSCGFTPDPAFEQMLASHGIARSTRHQEIGLMALNVRRELVEAIAVARYPAPTIDDLMALTAVGVTGGYIRDLANAGYRPESLDSLVQFRALNVTAEWIGGLVRIGYANIPAGELMQLKALNVSPDFIAGFERIGYRRLPAETLVQFKALNITPEFVAGFDQVGYRNLPASDLMQLRALNITPEFARSAAAGRSTMPPVDELVQLRVLGRRR